MRYLAALLAIAALGCAPPRQAARPMNLTDGQRALLRHYDSSTEMAEVRGVGLDVLIEAMGEPTAMTAIRRSDGSRAEINTAVDSRGDFICPCYASWRGLVRNGESGWAVVASVNDAGVVQEARLFPPFMY